MRREKVQYGAKGCKTAQKGAKRRKFQSDSKRFNAKPVSFTEVKQEGAESPRR